jgi:hypothetical protein
MGIAPLPVMGTATQHVRRGRLTRAAPVAMSLIAAALLGACGGEAAPPEDSLAVAAAPQAAFWANIAALCGTAYRGRMTEGGPGDADLANSELVMHVRGCSADTLRIPFHVGANRSRTWILTRTDGGLRLKHDHRHEDGSEDSITQYGGDTRDAGSAQRQEFYADSLTASLIPAARTNVWTIELVPDSMYAYALRREGTDRRVRVEFDLRQPVDTPPPPWGTP